jgi:hypothetical protein
MVPVSGTGANAFRGLYKRWEFLIKGFAVTIAAGWTLFEYRASVQDTRVREVLNYREQLRNEPLYDVWRRTTITMLEETPEKAKAMAGNDAEARNFVFGLTSDPTNRDALDTLISFYDELWQCVKNEICDRKTALALFGRESLLVYDNYRPYLACAQRQDPDYALGLTSLFENYFEGEKGRLARPYLPSAAECEGTL